MQFSGQDCVKQNESPLPLGHHLSFPTDRILTTAATSVGPTRSRLILFNAVAESPLPFVGSASSSPTVLEASSLPEGRVENIFFFFSLRTSLLLASQTKAPSAKRGIKP